MYLFIYEKRPRILPLRSVYCFTCWHCWYFSKNQDYKPSFHYKYVSKISPGGVHFSVLGLLVSLDVELVLFRSGLSIPSSSPACFCSSLSSCFSGSPDSDNNLRIIRLSLLTRTEALSPEKIKNRLLAIFYNHHKKLPFLWLLIGQITKIVNGNENGLCQLLKRKIIF